MINDTISNPMNSADDFCNVIINTSNDIAKDLGVTYGELWSYTTFLVIGLIVFYMVLTYAALYTKHTRIIKWAPRFDSSRKLYPNEHHVNTVRKSIIE